MAENEEGEKPLRIVFRGMWHGYNSINHVHEMDKEEYADMLIEDEGNCLRVQAGCRTQWMSHETAIKLGLAQITAALQGIKRNQRPFVFVLKPRRKTLKELVLDKEQKVVFRNNSIYVNGKWRSLKVWTLSARPNPAIADLESEEGKQRLLLASVIRSLVRYAGASAIEPLEKEVKRLYERPTV